MQMGPKFSGHATEKEPLEKTGEAAPELEEIQIEEETPADEVKTEDIPF